MREPRVSIVISTWNRSRLLRRALESALSQTLEDIEIVVSDNGSTDDTREVVREYDDPRLRYSRVEHNLGLHGGLNRALGLATAPYVAMLHDDDMFYPRNVEVKAAFFDAHPTVGTVYSPVDVLDAHGTVVKHDVSYGGRPAPGVESAADYRRRTMQQIGLNDFSATMLRRSAVHDQVFEVEDGPHCDLGLRLRMSLRSDFGYLDEVLTARMQHEGSLSATTGIETPSEAYHFGVTFKHIEGVDVVKRRFLREFAAVLDDHDELERACDAWLPLALSRVVFNGNQADRRLRPTVESIRAAARIDSRVLRQRLVVGAVAACLVGARGRQGVRSLNRALRSRSGPS
jgi:glycosyltransferase involved in cell wall biosynthesis